jgi:hypothetical protein
MRDGVLRRRGCFVKLADVSLHVIRRLGAAVGSEAPISDEEATSCLRQLVALEVKGHHMAN